MRARSLFFYCLLCGAAAVSAREGAASLSLDSLRLELAAHLNQKRFHSAQWGIKIASLSSGALLFEHNPEKLLKPASNAKLYTGALALDTLGPQFRIRTSLYSTKAPREGVLPGDLIVYGRGDPSFSTRFGLHYTNLLESIVQAVRDAGIRRVEGDLVADSTFFSGPPFGTGWNWDDLQYYYGAEVTALPVQDNTIDLRIEPGPATGDPCRITAQPLTDFVEIINRTRTSAPKSFRSISIERPLGGNKAFISGSLPKESPAWNDAVTVPHPTLWFALLLKEALSRSGIDVKGSPRSVENPQSSASPRKELGAVQSPPLGEIVVKMMTVSQNLYSQLLLLQVGAQARNKPAGLTTEELGIRELRSFAGRAGIDPQAVLLDDGAGLSRSCLVTPAATVQLLRFMAAHKHGDEFRASLPEPGGEGTLRNRLHDLKGKLRAKTGTLRFVDTLAGYLRSAAGEELVFCVMLNAYNPPEGASSRNDLDAVPRLLARLNEPVKP